jgi:hypothetical protein
LKALYFIRSIAPKATEASHIEVLRGQGYAVLCRNANGFNPADMETCDVVFTHRPDIHAAYSRVGIQAHLVTGSGESPAVVDSVSAGKTSQPAPDTSSETGPDVPYVVVEKGGGWHDVVRGGVTVNPKPMRRAAAEQLCKERNGDLL